MPEPALRQQAAARASLAAHGLAIGRSLDHFSLALTLLALAALLWSRPPPVAGAALLVAFAAGLAEKFYALRVAFDRRVIADWARRWEKPDFPLPAAELAAFDEALEAAGLRRAGNGGGHSLEGRLGGAMGLIKRQAVWVVLQAAALAGASLAEWPSLYGD